MVVKDNEKTKRLFMNMLENAAAYSRDMKARREVQMWKAVEIPCSLHDALCGLTKSEMDIIRKNYDFKNLSALKKGDLAKTLARLIPVNFKPILYRLDQNRYDLIKMIIDHSGVLMDMKIKAENLSELRDFCLVFPGIDNQHRVLFIPDELSAVFSQLDGPELKGIVRRNTQWICLAHGMLHYYGVMGIRSLMEKIEILTNQKIDMLEFIQVMTFACNFYGQLRFTSAGYQNRKVSHVEQIIQEQQMRSGLDYYSFSKKQLTAASDPDYIDKTPEINRFIHFLLEYYEISTTDLNELILEINKMINNQKTLIQILQYLQSRLTFPSFEFAEQLTEIVSALHNSTRQWILKGNTPEEVFKEERKHLKPLPKEPFKNSKQTSTTSKPHVGKNKVGRNDLCPCGSGKKFKKCCGE